MRVILFLFKNYEFYENDQTDKFAYHVLAPLPGKFLFDNNMNLHHFSELLSDTSKISNEEFTKFSNFTYEEFKKELAK